MTLVFLYERSHTLDRSRALTRNRSRAQIARPVFCTVPPLKKSRSAGFGYRSFKSAGDCSTGFSAGLGAHCTRNARWFSDTGHAALTQAAHISGGTCHWGSHWRISGAAQIIPVAPCTATGRGCSSERRVWWAKPCTELRPVWGKPKPATPADLSRAIAPCELRESAGCMQRAGLALPVRRFRDVTVKYYGQLDLDCATCAAMARQRAIGQAGCAPQWYARFLNGAGRLSPDQLMRPTEAHQRTFSWMFYGGGWARRTASSITLATRLRSSGCGCAARRKPPTLRD